ncbi:MFS transporter [Pseudonocardia sulfidoxydans NBRC 16205]|uniref:MFS transporter n=1 Tax=Pseudonocardia sulfidoxydans NBRC 16205 TaxID=1223511 RepID=A0A511DTA1_9PSEU|nr:MFS transporter [Pseudonocardia sulfidoxydans NBRC 16205]
MQRRRAAAASFIGATVEFYDFFLYGTAAALVFGPQFFPSFSATAGTLAALGTFLAGFVARPIGGVVMGHYGDRIGRRAMLVVSLMVVGVTTIGIGVLPTYAQIGVWAPIGLVVLRLLQGLALGGEWSGAVLMSVEHAPPGRRGLYGVFPLMGAPGGLLLGNIAFLLTSGLAGPAFTEWAWRIPFLASAVLIGVGFFLRLRVSESPAFAELARERDRSSRPLLEVLRHHPRAVLVGAGLPLAGVMSFYIFAVHMLTYMTTTVQLSRLAALIAVLAATVACLIGMFATGPLSDRFGARRVLIAGLIWLAVAAAIGVPLIDTGVPAAYLPAMVLLGIGSGAAYGPIGTMISALFPARVRFSGSSMSYQIATLVGGAPAPLIAAALVAATGTSMVVGIYIVVVVLVALTATLAFTRVVPTS